MFSDNSRRSVVDFKLYCYYRRDSRHLYNGIESQLSQCFLPFDTYTIHSGVGCQPSYIVIGNNLQWILLFPLLLVPDVVVTIIARRILESIGLLAIVARLQVDEDAVSAEAYFTGPTSSLWCYFVTSGKKNATIHGMPKGSRHTTRRS